MRPANKFFHNFCYFLIFWPNELFLMAGRFDTDLNIGVGWPGLAGRPIYSNSEMKCQLVSIGWWNLSEGGVAGSQTHGLGHRSRLNPQTHTTVVLTVQICFIALLQVKGRVGKNWNGQTFPLSPETWFIKFGQRRTIEPKLLHPEQIEDLQSTINYKYRALETL